jgi:hypothetical protein
MSTLTRKAVRTQVRDAIVELLRELVSSGDLREVRPYSGELGGKVAEDVMRALNGMAPGILVATESGIHKGVQVQRRRTHRDLGVVLYLVSTSQDTREDRADQLARIEELVLERLLGVKPEIDVGCGVFEPVSEKTLAHEPHVCIWQQDWRITVQVDRLEKPAAPITDTLGRINAPQDEDNAADPIVQVSTLITMP